MKIFLLWFCLTFATCLAAKDGCPSKEDIRPCTCKGVANTQPSMFCDGINSQEQLLKSLKNINTYKVNEFNIMKSNIGVLPSNIFYGMDVRILNIEYTNITSLSEGPNKPAFNGLEGSLAYLKIKDAFINEKAPLTRLSFSHLKKLYRVQLEGNMMPTIGNDWFETGPYELNELYLQDTYTTKVGSHAFSSLIKLKRLALTGGSITEVKREMFPSPAVYLEFLDLSNNDLPTLPNNLFSQMPSLKEVNFDNNALTTISELSFSLVWSQMERLHFYGNPLNCTADMKWMFKYRLPAFIYGYCVAPPKLLNKVLPDLTLADFE